MTKTKSTSVSFLTFIYLLSGSVLYGGFYRCGNPIICFALGSLLLAVYAGFTGRFFAKRTNGGNSLFSKVFGIVLCILLSVLCGFAVNAYSSGLGDFAEYYGKGFVEFFAAGAVLFFGMYLAGKGKTSVFGFARISAGLLAFLTLIGVLGFFYTKSAAAPDFSPKSLGKIDFWNILQNCAVLYSGIPAVYAVSADNAHNSEKTGTAYAVLKGVWAYIAVGGANVIKNVLLFGEDFVSAIENPDLAAIRLIPMFELPEISVIADTAALCTRLSVYCCAMFFALKDAFGEKYRAGISSAAVYTAIFGISAVLTAAEAVPNMKTAAVFSVLSVLFLFIFFGRKKYREATASDKVFGKKDI